MSRRGVAKLATASVITIVLSLVLALSSTIYFGSAKENRSVLGTSNEEVSYSGALLNGTANEINSLRESRGLSKLKQSKVLDSIAQERANDMASQSYYSHKGSDGKFFSDKMKEQKIGYAFACENLNIQEPATSHKYIETWLASPAHKDCILKDSHRYAGYGTALIPSVNGVPLNQKVIVAIYSD